MDQSQERGQSNPPHTMQSSPSVPLDEKKRTRIQLSCTSCRYRKLKCDRTLPCNNCVKRRLSASCRYVGPPRMHPRPGPSNSEPESLQARLEHLENLVHSYIERRATESQGNQQPDLSKGLRNVEHEHTEESELPDEDDKSVDSQGRILVDNVGTSYIDAAHWKAILEDIREVKQDFQDDSMTLEVEASEGELPELPGPFLLLGAANSISKEELLESLPPRPVVDALVSRYFNSKDHSLFIIHTPSFQKEYTEFWHHPQSVSVSWLGLLYSIMSLSILIYNRVQDPLPAPLQEVPDAIGLYRKLTAQCLLYTNYMNPGPYDIETLIKYLLAEYARSNDAQTGVSILLGIIIKLAMHMGYHRDPKHYPNISAFDGEMRRRVWLMICQFESLISFQVGLPRVIQDWQCDVKPPHNLRDEDFDRKTTELPPPRQITDRTPVSYMVSKAKINSVFGKVADMLFSHKRVPYEDIIKLDKSLQEAHATKPPFLQMRPTDLLITDPPDLVMQRYTLELLYQKTRCVLHRKYLTRVNSNLRYAYSRWAAVNAAREILRHHADIHRETQPGGQLYRDRWFIGSLQYHDFLLAAMIICLELSQNHESRPQTQSQQLNEGFKVTYEGREELYEALERSYQIWKSDGDESADAYKASEVLAVILQKVRKSSPDIPHSDRGNSIEAKTRKSPPQNLESQTHSSRSVADTPSMAGQQETPDSMPPGWLGAIGEMIDVPDDFDWQLWDDQMRLDNLDQF
ncbi:fungal-specific transcription factor domain-containing protein [Xylogone sp. PMI_703]|nr:fungal-specific transcription factor domain-containing protein [Xylogone sp. PMI_703]